MSQTHDRETTSNGTRANPRSPDTALSGNERRPACPVCGGALIEIRAKLVCARCHTICETCCEGGPG